MHRNGVSEALDINIFPGEHAPGFPYCVRAFGAQLVPSPPQFVNPGYTPLICSLGKQLEGKVKHINENVSINAKVMQVAQAVSTFQLTTESIIHIKCVLD